MKVHKERICRKLDSVFCDVCGNNCKKQDAHDNEHALLSATWGYDSRKDLTRHEIDLCEDCFDKVIDFLKSQRSTVPKDKDPLDGFDYGLPQ